MNNLQYEMCELRRQNYNTLLWSTPSFAVAAQGFLYGVIFNSDTIAPVALGLSIVSVGLAAASFMFFERLRWLEVHDSLILQRFEHSSAARRRGFVHLHDRPEARPWHRHKDVSGVSAHLVWRLVLAGLLVVALSGNLYAVMRLANADVVPAPRAGR